MNNPAAITLPQPDMRKSSNPGVVVKSSNIRIWIHDRDIGRLQQLLWEGYGDKLRVETSSNPQVKKFLNSVPYIMGIIKDVHRGAVNEDLDLVQRRTQDPVPKEVLLSKDLNGLTPLHKAAGLGHEEVAKYILERAPEAASVQDKEDRAPLHYCACLKGDRQDAMVQLLTSYGAQADLQDKRGKRWTDYRRSVRELEGSRLKVVPEAPRTAASFPPSWDWTSEPPPAKAQAIPTADSTPSADSAFGDDNTNDIDKLETTIDEDKTEADDEGYSDPQLSTNEEIASKEEEGGENMKSDGGGDKEDRSEGMEEPGEEERELGREGEEGGDAGAESREEEEAHPGDGERLEVEERDQEEQREEEQGEEEQGEEEQGNEEQVEEQPEEEQAAEEQAAPPPSESDPPDSAEDEVDEAVRAGSMEKLAELVLEGKGALLVDKVSDNPDVQLFLNNVPQYMAKIKGVHKAAREGDLRAVQRCLDRRKFAVSVDNSTPLKPTPLHVASLFGRTSVLRYLAGRFPETMHAQDSKGRTPLHYAATLPDNGHFYSLLITLGADTSIIDQDGNTAEYYLKNGGLTNQELVQEYQQRTDNISSGDVNSNPFGDKGAEFIRSGYPSFAPDEGQYLANSLGEPLVKGLTEVAQLKPKDPIMHLANYLLQFVNNEQSIQNDNAQDQTEEVTEDIEKTDAGSETKNDIEVVNYNKEGEKEIEVVNENDDIGDILEDDGKEEDLEREDDEGSEDGRGSPRPLSSAFKPINRDEHGQSVLHYACARTHGRNGLFQLLTEVGGNIGLRDGLYRTARDVAEQVELPENVAVIDKYVVSLAATGENDKLNELILDGYDHILDTKDEDKGIMEIVQERENEATLSILKGIPSFEEKRERLQRAVRFGSQSQVQDLLRGGKSLALAKSQQSRTSLHIAVLCQHENIVQLICSKYPETLRIGDNLMRTPLHYAMGVEKVEVLSSFLITSGAERVVKDLKGRQPSYYFMNKTDIQKLQDEEEALTV